MKKKIFVLGLALTLGVGFTVTSLANANSFSIEKTDKKDKKKKGDAKKDASCHDAKEVKTEKAGCAEAGAKKSCCSSKTKTS